MLRRTRLIATLLVLGLPCQAAVVAGSDHPDEVIVEKGKHQLHWTRGCIAVSNAEIDELFAQVKTNTRIRILP